MEGFDVIYSYTRKEAIENGDLHDITDIAKEAGFKVPIAVTNALFEAYLNPTSEEKEMGQSLDGRIWDMLSILFYAANGNSNSGILKLEISIMFENGRKDVPFKSVIGPGDNGEPVITLMLPDED